MGNKQSQVNDRSSAENVALKNASKKRCMHLGGRGVVDNKKEYMKCHVCSLVKQTQNTSPLMAM